MSKGSFVKKNLLVMVVIVLGISAAFYIGLQSKLNKFSEEVSKISINDIDISTLNDGTYSGEYFVNESVGAIVKVTVKDNKITDIDFIEHKHGKGKKAEAITDIVIEKQSLNVDAISGATGSSTVILKAIDNALNK